MELLCLIFTGVSLGFAGLFAYNGLVVQMREALLLVVACMGFTLMAGRRR